MGDQAHPVTYTPLGLNWAMGEEAEEGRTPSPGGCAWCPGVATKVLLASGSQLHSDQVVLASLVPTYFQALVFWASYHFSELAFCSITFLSCLGYPESVSPVSTQEPQRMQSS